MKLHPYAKAIVAIAVAALTVAASAITDNMITQAEWINIMLAALGAIGVYGVKNRQP